MNGSKINFSLIFRFYTKQLCVEEISCVFLNYQKLQNCNLKKMMITTLFQMFSLLQTVSFDVLSWKICFLGLAFLTFFKTRKVFLTKLTVFALAFLDQILIFDVFMTGFAVKPGSVEIENNKEKTWYSSKKQFLNTCWKLPNKEWKELFCILLLPFSAYLNTYVSK